MYAYAQTYRFIVNDWLHDISMQMHMIMYTHSKAYTFIHMGICVWVYMPIFTCSCMPVFKYMHTYMDMSSSTYTRILA